MYTVWIIWLWYPNRNLAVCLWEFNMSFIVYSIRNSPLHYYSHISQIIAYTLYPNIWFSQKSIIINKPPKPLSAQEQNSEWKGKHFYIWYDFSCNSFIKHLQQAARIFPLVKFLWHSLAWFSLIEQRRSFTPNVFCSILGIHFKVRFGVHVFSCLGICNLC